MCSSRTVRKRGLETVGLRKRNVTRQTVLKPTATPRGTVTGAATGSVVQRTADTDEMKDLILHILDDAKAEDTVAIDLRRKTPVADHMIVTSGRSDRHVGAIAEQLQTKLKQQGVTGLKTEGLPHCDWVLIDAGDVIVHVFRPEVRSFYNLEKMWSADAPEENRAVV